MPPLRDDSTCGPEPTDSATNVLGELPDLLRELRTKDHGDFREHQAALARTLLRDPLPDLPVEMGGDDMDRLVDRWTEILRHSLALDTPPDRVLCGFNSVADVIYSLTADEVDEFIRRAA